MLYCDKLTWGARGFLREEPQSSEKRLFLYHTVSYAVNLLYTTIIIFHELLL